MNRLFVAIARVALSFTLAGLPFAAIAGQQTVDVSDLARCRAISGAGERLACYDSLEARAVAGARNAPAATPTDTASSWPAASDSTQGPAAAGAPTGVATAPGAAAPTGAATAPGAQLGGTAAGTARSTDLDDPANFGLSLHQLKATPAAKGPEQIKSVVSRMTQDRLNNVDLLLDNGQTWRLIEPDPRVRPGDAVTIKRAALGSYLLLTPSRRSYRIERTN